MALVTGYTAEYMDEIVNSTIASAAVVGDDLILERHDETTINAGNVRGPQGPIGDTGPQGPGNATDSQVAGFVNTAASLSQVAVDNRAALIRVTTNWNNATTPGRYYGGGASNSPNAANGYVGTVHSNGLGQTVQTLYRDNVSAIADQQIWQRRSYGATPTWTPWLSLFKDTGWVALPFSALYNQPAGAEVPQYRVKNGTVQLKGAFKIASGSDFTAGTTYTPIASGVPAAIMPSQRFNSICTIMGSVSSAFARILVNPENDTFTVTMGPVTTAWLYLGGATYAAAS